MLTINTRLFVFEASFHSLFVRLHGVGEGFFCKGSSVWSPWSEIAQVEGRRAARIASQADMA